MAGALRSRWRDGAGGSVKGAAFALACGDCRGGAGDSCRAKQAPTVAATEATGSNWPAARRSKYVRAMSLAGALSSTESSSAPLTRFHAECRRVLVSHRGEHGESANALGGERRHVGATRRVLHLSSATRRRLARHRDHCRCLCGCCREVRLGLVQAAPAGLRRAERPRNAVSRNRLPGVASNGTRVVR